MSGLNSGRFLSAPEVLWLHVLSDATIAATYYSIPLVLIYLIRRRKDIPFKGIFWLFGISIFLCGTTHLMSVWGSWYPDYEVEGILKAATAVASIAFLFMLLKLIPAALTLASPEQLHRQNLSLQDHIQKRDQAQGALQTAFAQMESVAEERTLELMKKNEMLEAEIEKRNKAQQQLGYMLDELTRSNTDLERFAYICSHDLQEPLRMVANYSQKLTQHLSEQLDERGRHYLRYINDGADHARILINDVLSFSRIGTETEKPELIKCLEVLEMVLRMLRGSLEQSHAMLTHDPLPVLRIHRTHLVQLLQNLISNAIKFRSTEPLKIHIGVRPVDHFWEISVQDNGIGISEQYQHKIFEIFQRLHKRTEYPGSGIGLAVCKKIVEQYHGTISLSSKPGKGSCFTFTLPMADAATGSL